MIINKEITSKILRDYIFITGTVDIDSKYFKKRIDEGIQNSNLNHKTNVYGKHTHEPSYLSGVLYLNDHYQKLYFPEINQEITPKPGRFVIFSSFLQHQTKRNIKHKSKYAISFNFRHVTVSETF